MVAMVAMAHRSLVFLLRVQVADVSQAGTATAGRTPRPRALHALVRVSRGARVC